MAKQINFGKILANSLACLALILSVSNCSKADAPIERTDYEIAPPVYAALAEKSLDLLTSFQFDSWSSMLSDSIIYYFPDGDKNTRTKLEGKTALLAWWKNYKNTSGLESMTIEGANYLPIEVRLMPRNNFKRGVIVYSYFSNKMIFQRETVALQMNFVFHFDKEKMIDQIMTFYDTSPIIKVSGKKFL